MAAGSEWFRRVEVKCPEGGWGRGEREVTNSGRSGLGGYARVVRARPAESCGWVVVGEGGLGLVAADSKR